MTTMKPCPRCHSTEHLHIEIIDDNLTANRSVKAGCTECHTFAQIDYVFTGPSGQRVQARRRAVDARGHRAME